MTAFTHLREKPRMSYAPLLWAVVCGAGMVLFVAAAVIVAGRW